MPVAWIYGCKAMTHLALFKCLAEFAKGHPDENECEGRGRVFSGRSSGSEAARNIAARKITARSINIRERITAEKVIGIC